MAHRAALGWANPIGPLIEAIASHALWLLAGLVVLTLAAAVTENELNSRLPSHDLLSTGEPDPAP